MWIISLGTVKLSSCRRRWMIHALQWRHNERHGVSNHQTHDCAGQRKHQSSASLAFVRGIHRGPMNSPYKGRVTRKVFPFDDVVMAKHSLPTYEISLLPTITLQKLHSRWSAREFFPRHSNVLITRWQNMIDTNMSAVLSQALTHSSVTAN